jgi:hypothetical protein
MLSKKGRGFSPIKQEKAPSAKLFDLLVFGA